MKTGIKAVYWKTLFAVTAWGGSFIATKVALRELAPFTLVWARFLIGIVILGLGVVWRGQFQRLPLKTLLYLAGLGAIGITFHQGLQSSGLVTAQASTTAWIVASTPIFIALLGWLFLKERVTWLKAGGIILAAAGVLMFLLSRPIILVIYGERWLDSLEAFRILIVYGVSKAVASLSSMTLFALDRPWIVTIASFMMAGLFALFCVPMTRLWGIEGTAGAVVASGVLSHLFAVTAAAIMLSGHVPQKQA